MAALEWLKPTHDARRLRPLLAFASSTLLPNMIEGEELVLAKGPRLNAKGFPLELDSSSDAAGTKGSSLPTSSCDLGVFRGFYA